MGIEHKKIGCIGHDCDECAERAKTERRLQKESRELRRTLQKLSDSVLVYLRAMDTKIAPNKAIPRDVSEWLGKTCGALEMQNDLARQAAGMGFTAAGKTKALKKLMGANAGIHRAAEGRPVE